MKKILFVTLIIFFSAAGFVFAQNWHTANSVQIAWNEVTTNESGDQIDPAEVSYVVYMSNATTDPEKANPVEVDQSTNTVSTITLNTEGKYFVGVKAIRTVGGEVVAESAIAWSDNPLYVGAANEFGVQYFLPPAAPTGLRPQ